MKIKIEVTVDLTPAQVKILARMAKDSGHSYGDVTAPGKLIRRYLTSKVLDVVTYCHEKRDAE